ncbi:MAG: protein-methionine-sulfoxide reductase heme-binding subunit MsrQ [Vicinamibacterales bacterium]
MTAHQFTRWVLKPVTFVACLGPAVYLVWALFTGNLSANPLSDVTNETGVWTLRFLCLTLAMTPLRRLSGWNGAIRFRRMVGLYAFFYGTLHLMTYVILDRFAGLDFSDGLSLGTIMSWKTARGLAMAVAADIYKRPFIMIGSLAFVSMVPLAATSTAGMIRRLGGRRWQALHRLVYVSAIAGVTHYWWLVKADVARPQRYAIVVGVLLLLRVYWARLKRTSKADLRGSQS